MARDHMAVVHLASTTPQLSRSGRQGWRVPQSQSRTRVRDVSVVELDGVESV